MNRRSGRFNQVIAAVAAVVGVALASPAQAQSGACAVDGPIVLVPGLLNGPFDPSISQTLRECGATVVQADGIDATNSSMVRGMQLLASLERILASTGAEKVHVLAHSQAGPDSRVVLGMRPEILASLTHFAGVNQGTGAAAAGALLGSENIRTILAEVVTSFGGEEGTEAGFQAALGSLNIMATQQFNQMFPAGLPTTECGEGPPTANGVAIQSFGGVGLLTNAADVADFAFLVTGVAVGDPSGESDGLVGRCSTHFGSVQRDNLNYNHLDFLNQVNGLVAPDADVPALVRMIYTDLAQQGL